MSLRRFVVTSPFIAWSPGDRDRAGSRISILPGPKHLFTEEIDPSGAFVKFLKGGSWYEADRNVFAGATVPVREHQEARSVSAQRGA